MTRERLRAGLAVVGLFCVYLVTSSRGWAQNVDPISAFLPAWNLGQHGTLDVPQFDGVTPWIQPHGDKVLSDRMPGVILWAVPFYRAMGTPYEPSPFVAAVAAVTAATVAMCLLYLLFRKFLTTRTAVTGTALVAFGTATWTVSADALWPHAPNQMWLAGALLLMSTQTWWGAGLAYAAAIMTRPHLAVTAAVCGLWEGATRRSIKPVLQIGVTSALGVLGLVAYNKLVFTQPALLVGVYAQRPTNATGKITAAVAAQDPALLLSLLGTFVSPERGVLVLSPFLIMLLPGLRKAWRVAPSWARAAATGGVAYMVVQLFGNGFAGGTGFYSYRLPIESLTLAAPLLCLCWREWTSQSRRRRVAFAALAVFSVVQHAVGAFIFMDASSGIVRSWERYLLVEGLQQATLLQLVALGVVGAAAAFVAHRQLRQVRPPGMSADERLADYTGAAAR